MKPEKVSSVLLVAAQDTNVQSFLFQCATHWADQSLRVLYMSATPCSQLPPPVHGMQAASSDTLSQITFMYLPRWQDLLKQMYSLHEYTHIPKVIIVEGLEHYCSISDRERSGEKYDAEVHGALVCASLLDAAAVCAKSSDDGAVLVASVRHNPSQWGAFRTLVDLFFNDTVWFVSREHSQEAGAEGGGTVVVDQATCSGQAQKTRIEFVHMDNDGTLVLQKILKLIKSHK